MEYPRVTVECRECGLPADVTVTQSRHDPRMSQIVVWHQGFTVGRPAPWDAMDDGLSKPALFWAADEVLRETGCA